MPENQKNGKVQHGVGCMCPACSSKMCVCGCGWHGGWILRLVRWIFAIVILAIVFSFGVKIGEIRGELEYGYGHRMMVQSPYGYDNRAYPMMQNGQGMATSSMPTGLGGAE